MDTFQRDRSGAVSQTTVTTSTHTSTYRIETDPEGRRYVLTDEEGGEAPPFR
jgi:hypothetical protein